MEPRSSHRSGFLSPPFLAVLALLGSAAFLDGVVGDWLGYTQVPEKLELRRDLHLFDEKAIWPYRPVSKNIHSPETVGSLGTDKYLSWVLEDTSAAPDSPLRFAQVDVTYYTGGIDLAPHTPDVCVVASGYEPVTLRSQTVDVGALGAEDRELPVRVCTFEKTSVFDAEQFTVVYTFFCNGRFVNESYDVRSLVRNPRYTYAFFSKVEVSFYGPGMSGYTRADRDTSVAGATRLLGVLLPILRDTHWPDFEAAEAAAHDRSSKPSEAATGAANS
jgi:hypothetical protein